MRLLSTLLLAVFALLLPQRAAVAALDCAAFDAAKVKIVTFDVFAALFDLYDSLDLQVPSLLVRLLLLILLLLLLLLLTAALSPPSSSLPPSCSRS